MNVVEHADHKRLWAAALVLSLLVFTGCARMSAPPLEVLASVDAVDEAIKGPGLVFVGFCQHDCSMCKTMKPHVEELVRDYGTRIRFVTLYVDSHKEAIMRYKVFKTPDQRLYRDGKLIKCWTGFNHTHDMMKVLDSALSN